MTIEFEEYNPPGPLLYRARLYALFPVLDFGVRAQDLTMLLPTIGGKFEASYEELTYSVYGFSSGLPLPTVEFVARYRPKGSFEIPLTFFGEGSGSASGSEAGATGEDPSRGGCLRLGWGCLPVTMGLAMLPLGHFFF